MITDKKAITRLVELAAEMCEIANEAGGDWGLSLVMDDNDPEIIGGFMIGDRDVAEKVFGSEVAGSPTLTN